MESQSMPGVWPRAAAPDAAPHREQPEPQPQEPQNQEQPHDQPRQRHYGSRTCRICLEEVQPKFPEGLGTTLGIRRTPRPVYVSEDPELGRLMSPCKCKGSQRFVHQGCLQAWRDADPMNKRNYFHCPTCGFKYRLGRMSWARWVSSEVSQIILTLVIVFFAIFLLGFVADPILDMWSDPVSTIADTVATVVGEEPDPDVIAAEPDGWLEHFVKGFFSLGVVGFLKVFFAMSPWHWWNLRNSGVFNAGGRRPGMTGRGRVENISWAVVIIGAITVVYSMWKGVRFISRRTLLAASYTVLDIGNDEDDDDGDGEANDGHEHQE